jgi:hypothetical protein
VREREKGGGGGEREREEKERERERKRERESKAAPLTTPRSSESGSENPAAVATPRRNGAPPRRHVTGPT